MSGNPFRTPTKIPPDISPNAMQLTMKANYQTRPSQNNANLATIMQLIQKKI